MTYHDVAERENFILVSPRGMADFQGGDDDKYIGWNIGLLDDGIAAADKLCFEGSASRCYDSCHNECSRCSGTTCVDDAYFVE